MGYLGDIRVLMLKGEKGDQGDSGTSGDYSGLSNKPSINGQTLSGNKTSEELGLASAGGVQAIVSALMNKFVLIEDSVSVNAESAHTKSYGAYVLSNTYGIDDIENYMVLSVVADISSNTFVTCYKPYNEKLYPHSIIDGVNLQVAVYNQSSSNRTVNFKVLLYRIAEDE